jgi:DNA polymerase III delta prime subunit
MRGSVVLYGSTQHNRQLKVTQLISKELDQKLAWNYLENFPDIKIIDQIEDKKSIGIAQAREGIHFLQEKPLALLLKVLIVNRAHLMTDEAQNAMLKTLEEPPDYALIFLLSKTEGALLPTVLSRCRKFKTYVEPSADSLVKAKTEHTLNYLLSLTKGQKLDWAEEMAKEDKDTIIDILENWLEEGRDMLKSEPHQSTGNNLELVIATLQDLENTNVGTRIALENLVVQME